MVAKDFEQFVASQQTDLDASADRAQIVDEWLQNLRLLYEEIAGFLHEFVSTGSISFGFTKIEINEPELGTYLADRMDIIIGRQHVSLIPVGTLLVGCKGRVDVQGSSGQTELLLLKRGAKGASDLASGDRDGEPWTWKIVSNTIPRQFVELDRELFFELVMQVANA